MTDPKDYAALKHLFEQALRGQAAREREALGPNSAVNDAVWQAVGDHYQLRPNRKMIRTWMAKAEKAQREARVKGKAYAAANPPNIVNGVCVDGPHDTRAREAFTVSFGTPDTSGAAWVGHNYGAEGDKRDKEVVSQMAALMLENGVSAVPGQHVVDEHGVTTVYSAEGVVLMQCSTEAADAMRRSMVEARANADKKAVKP